jgi:hypothetical protein
MQFRLKAVRTSPEKTLRKSALSFAQEAPVALIWPKRDRVTASAIVDYK